MTESCIGIRKFIGHNWDTWDIPVQSKRVIAGMFSTNTQTVNTQSRRCKLCGLVETRIVSVQPIEVEKGNE